jgi:O-acetyl-ADP-ribose deacetylase (regulator of RNase III)
MPSQIEVVQGDITEQKVDAIVNAANNNLWMGTGVAGAIIRKGGPGIEAEAIAQAPIQVGGAVITGGGTLPANHVIHAAAMGQDLATDGEKIRDATVSALELAEDNNLQSIAFPAIGTGVGRFPPDECARIMVGAARERSTGERAVPLVRFVLFDEPGYQAFRRAAR